MSCWEVEIEYADDIDERILVFAPTLRHAINETVLFYEKAHVRMKIMSVALSYFSYAIGSPKGVENATD